MTSKTLKSSRPRPPCPLLPWRIPTAAAAVVGASLWIFGLTLWTHTVMERASLQSNSGVVSPNALVEEDFHVEDISIVRDIWPDDHDDAEFAESLTSCVDDCLSDPPPTPQRIGLLYPPGDFGMIFVDFVYLAASKHAAHTTGEIMWEPTSHLPSSIHVDGHRYSHIVRFATLPVILAVGDAVLQFGSDQEIRWQDIMEGTDLLLWWHCQLSNLAQPGSSFPLLTMTMEQIEEDALQQSIGLGDFIPGLEPNDDDDEEDLDADFESQMVDTIHDIVDRVKPLLLRLDGEFQKDPQKTVQDTNLESMVARMIADFLVDDVTCPSVLSEIKVPISDAARAVYESMKPLQALIDPQNHDKERCSEASVAEQRFCRNFPEEFDTQGLVKRLYEVQQENRENGQVNDDVDDVVETV